MFIDGYLVAKDRDTRLYKDEEDQYYKVEKISKTDAEKWLDETFDTIPLEIDDDVLDVLKKSANDCNMSLDCYVTTLLEELLYANGA